MSRKLLAVTFLVSSSPFQALLHPANKEEQTADDEVTIFAETAHIRDGELIVLDGNRKVQGGSSTDMDNEWDTIFRAWF